MVYAHTYLATRHHVVKHTGRVYAQMWCISIRMQRMRTQGKRSKALKFDNHYGMAGG